jgi:lipoprotein-releasing system permease protein
MFVILSILVLIAAMNIVSGLIMLVKNKGRDIGILRTMGLTEGSVLRVFFICGASTGLIGTRRAWRWGACSPSISTRSFLRELCGGGRGLGPVDPGHLCAAAKLQLVDVLSAVALSLGCPLSSRSFPRAARRG